MSRFNPPPNWPAPPAGWTPPPGWQPDATWPEPPSGWRLWVDDEPARGEVVPASQVRPMQVAPAAQPVPPLVQQQPILVQVAPTHTVSYQPVRTSHTFHLIMTICTAGLWLFVWIPIWIINNMRRRKVHSHTA